jgi:putative heme transporter
MFHSCGHGAAEITRAVVLTGIWNNLVKLGLPVVALGALALVGETNAALRAASLFGLLVLAAAVALLVLALVRPGTAHLLGRAAEGAAGRVARLRHRRPPTGWAERAEAFRTDSEHLLRRRWVYLSLAALGSHGLLFVVLLTCVRFVGGLSADVSWPHILAVFAVTRLITLVPITPGALGVAELSYVAGLVTVGVPSAIAAGAVLLFRALTWLLPIPIGATCWVLWRRGVGHRPQVHTEALAGSER